MKVRYTIPAHGKLRVGFDIPLVFDNWSFQLVSNENSGYVNQLIVEIDDIPKEKWPTLTVATPNPNSTLPTFPFTTNANTLRFTEVEPQLLNLESYLSIFGLERLSMDLVEEQWVSAPTDESTGMLSGFSVKFGEPQPLEPISVQTTARCIVASSSGPETTLFLAYFRVAQINFLSRLYIDAIKYSYLCLEELFANGKFKKHQTVIEFCKSSELEAAVQDLFFKNPTPEITLLRVRYPKLGINAQIKDVYDFIVDLRGRLQHANQHPAMRWHPSMQRNFETEAICLFSLVDQICYGRTGRRLAEVQTRYD